MSHKKVDPAGTGSEAKLIEVNEQSNFNRSFIIYELALNRKLKLLREVKQQARALGNDHPDSDVRQKHRLIFRTCRRRIRELGGVL